VLVARLARWHFAPTASARENLLREGVAADRITVTGNTVIDALLDVAARDLPFDMAVDPSRRLVLVTAHRRENFGARLEEICRALRALVAANPDIEILYPVHPNPRVQATVYSLLDGCERITLSEPLAYATFVGAMKRAYLILSDSGGVQEEAPALAKPVLVLRTETERPEAVDAGVVRIVGPDFDAITREAQRLLDDRSAYDAMARGVSPYGDGKAAGRIVDVLAASARVEPVTA
jgi:UDP-N-acetylglucosamine 2-epimerase (non-hydrolysing)